MDGVLGLMLERERESSKRGRDMDYTPTMLFIGGVRLSVVKMIFFTFGERL